MSGNSITVMEKNFAKTECDRTRLIGEATHPASVSSGIQRAHLYDYMEVLARRKWIVIIAFAMIVGTVAIVSFLLPARYETSARIFLGVQPTLVNPVSGNSEYIPERNSQYQTQVNLLNSRTMAHQVISDLGKDVISAMTSDSKPFLFSEADNRIENATVSDAIDGSLMYIDSKIKSQLLKWYLGNLRVIPVGDSNLVDISFSGTNAELITRIINKHAQAAIGYTVEQYQAQAKETLDWLKKQIDDQKTAVQRSQSAIYEFKKKHNVLSLEDRQVAFSKELQELNTEFIKAKSERITKQAAYMQLTEIARDQKDVLLIPEIANYPIVQNMRNQLVELNYRQIEMKTKYGPKHPKMIELDHGINQLRNEINVEVDRLKKTIASELARAQAIEDSIAASLSNQKQVAMSLTEKSIEYEVLKQQADSAQDVYEFLLKQSEQLGLSSVISSSNMRIVDRAEVPTEPSSPRIYLNVLIAIFLSSFVSTGLALLIDYMDNTVKTTEDLANRLGLPVLGMVPFQKKYRQKHGAIPHFDDPLDLKFGIPEDNALCHISSRLPQELRSRAKGFHGRVLIVDSVTTGEGKSSVAVRLASNLAESGQRVLLVDCDFQQPSLDALFDVPINVGGLSQFFHMIMTHDLSFGSLDEHSVDDLFFLIGLKKMSGHLMIKHEEQTFIAHFQHGALMHIQNQDSPVINRIGTMLVNGGFITKEQLDDALSRHARTGQPLGYILVNAGYIGRDKLRGPLRLQIEEYIQKIFSWKSGEFHFKHGMIRIYENERIFFGEDYSPMINNLGRTDISKFIEKELFSSIASVKKENLYLLPAGKPHNHYNSLNNVLMIKVFEKLKLNFDIILVDTSPIDAALGIESIFPYADGIVLVVKAGHLKVKTLNGAINHLPHDKIVGTVLNQAKVKTQVCH